MNPLRSKRLWMLRAAGLLVLLYGSTLLVTPFRPAQKLSTLELWVASMTDRAKLKFGVSGPTSSRSLETNLTTITQTTHKLAGDIRGWGGALTQVDGQIVLVDREGELYQWREGPNVNALAARVPMELNAFYSAIAGTKTDNWDTRTHFRVLDALARRTTDGYELIVSHNFWHQSRRAKSVRISALRFKSLAQIGEGTWRTVVECEPLLNEAAAPSSFATNQSGGRLEPFGSDRVLVTFGDQLFGSSSLPIEPLLPEGGNCFGRAYVLDPVTGRMQEFARGLRNPQGLHIDSAGTIWETEHGPRGGDELNILEERAHYGWPHVTYGTAYGSRDEFMPSTRQGQHHGYREPLFAWTPSVGISNLVRVNDARSAWDGDLLAGSLRQTALYRIRISEGRAVNVEEIPIGVRTRDLMQHPDGRYLIWTDAAELVELSVRPNPLIDESGGGSSATMAVNELTGCTHCHSMRERDNANGPTLRGVFNRAIGSTDYAAYSAALKGKPGRWTASNLQAFLSRPSEFAPGTTMPDMELNEAAVDDIVRSLEAM